ncbi:mechanosensitive ion channel family protein [Paenarthrobacter sp. DKR-5]|uniref:mechanosensitive ion channel family protein n=1 Tax=Paenarthrobacter sp. DKR-5 TaxID=2835535 RepID=UPI001BDD2656|nr:mechanosensitive ion channel domain-containing protein [Paenarthrobacter sp. DKR-5]MBT1002287.1 mechanosensitive ion channel family protein [Paenarthrobacter sp. DKR-5]
MQDLFSSAVPLLAILVAVAAGLILSWLIRKLVLRLNRRVTALRDTSRIARVPLRLTLCLVAVRIALIATTNDSPWRQTADHALLLALIASIGWLAVAVLLIVEALMLAHYSVDMADNRRARRLRTQTIMARRIGVALIVVLALGSALLTFPAVRALGAGLLASAGVISIVAGLAAQTSLVNVFAGLQLAFTDAIRVDDVVVVQKEWGRIEEITLTYVVVHIWDDRRLILPSTFFTTTPFENWTRRQSAVMGTVEFDLDWRAPIEDMRDELRAVLDSTELWDKRVGILQVTDATGGYVRVRILVSAADSGSLFDLRCLIRESLVTCLQTEHPEALPHTRWERVPPPAQSVPAGEDQALPGSAARRVARRPADPHESQLFTGSVEAVERSKAFTGPGEAVFEERDRNLAREKDGSGD